MKTTRYFEEQVLPRRPYIQREWCERAIREPIRQETQPDGRIRHWIYAVTIQELIRTNPNTGEGNIEYKLISLIPWRDERLHTNSKESL